MQLCLDGGHLAELQSSKVERLLSGSKEPRISGLESSRYDGHGVAIDQMRIDGQVFIEGPLDEDGWRRMDVVVGDLIACWLDSQSGPEERINAILLRISYDGKAVSTVLTSCRRVAGMGGWVKQL